MDKFYENLSKREFIYSIQEFSPPTKSMEAMGGWGLGSRLKTDFARKAYGIRLTEKSYKRLQETGRRIIEDSGLNYDNRNPYHFVQNKKEENTLLLQGCQAPGNTCQLGLDDANFDTFLNNPKEYAQSWISYNPHNVDSMSQASSLLSMWLKWINHVRSIVLPIKG